MSLSQDQNLPPFSITIQSDNNYKEKNISQLIDDFNSIIKSLKLIIPIDIEQETKEKINSYFIDLYNILNTFREIINENFIQNEMLQRKDEQNIRILYGKYFNQKLINEVLENKICILNKKEKEYELLKQKTGVIICNGQVICNERKDNEIIILRSENSLLKSAIKNNEDLLKEKNEIINNLNNDISLYKNQINELQNLKHGKYSSFSNINININEPKKDFIHKSFRAINKSYINTIQVFSSSTKNNLNVNSKTNNKNNIYSSYQINSQIINKVNSSKNKSKIIKKQEIFNKNGLSKNKKKNETIDALNNQFYSIKYISVNKSLFSQKNFKKGKIGFDNKDKKELQTNRIKNKYILNNNNLSNRECQTIIIEPNVNKEIKIKKAIINSRINTRHRKANSIQCQDSIKKLINEKKGKSLSLENDNNNHIYSAIRKLNLIKNQSLKDYNKSLPSSVINTNLKDDFRKNKQIKSQKCLTHFLMPYSEKRNDKKGRNSNTISKIGEDYIKNNSLSFFQKALINRTSCDNYNNKKNIFNTIYNNSNEISKVANSYFKK